MTRIATVVLAALTLLALAVQPALGATPKPKLGRTVLLKPAGGTVIVKPRGARRFKLREATIVPMRATIDTTKGKVKLTSALSSRRTQSGTFSQGAFVVTQRRSDGLTDLTLAGGDFSVCSAAKKANTRVSAAANKRRRLFGNARGRFRTRGRNSSATVRGTEWLTEDQCEGTKVVNRSEEPDSMVETQTRDLQFELKPGQTATGYCNKNVIEPDTYCMMLLAQPADGLLGAGIITQADRSEYALCVRLPSGSENCYLYPLSEPNEQGFRHSVLACPVGEPGEYFIGWSFDYSESHVNLLYPYLLSLVVDVAGPAVDCLADPAPPAA